MCVRDDAESWVAFERSATFPEYDIALRPQTSPRQLNFHRRRPVRNCKGSLALPARGRWPKSASRLDQLNKRFFDLEDLDRLSVASILEAAKHPAGFPVRLPEDGCEQLPVDWEEAERVALSGNCVLPNGRRVAPPGSPVVPKFVRDFIGFGDIQDPGRAVTLWKCAAALAEAGTPGPVVFGLLAEPAEKSGLDPDEVTRQIRSGIEHGARGGKGVNA